MSDSLQPYQPQPSATLSTVALEDPLCPWDSPGKNIGMGCHALLQRIFLTQRSNLRLLRLLPRLAGSLPLALPGKANKVSGICFKILRNKQGKSVEQEQSKKGKLIITDAAWYMGLYMLYLGEHYIILSTSVQNFKFYYHNTTKIKVNIINSQSFTVIVTSGKNTNTIIDHSEK